MMFLGSKQERKQEKMFLVYDGRGDCSYVSEIFDNLEQASDWIRRNEDDVHFHSMFVHEVEIIAEFEHEDKPCWVPIP